MKRSNPIPRVLSSSAIALVVAAIAIAAPNETGAPKPTGRAAGNVYSRQSPSGGDPALLVPSEMRFIDARASGAATVGLDQAEIQAMRLEADNSIRSYAASYPARKGVSVEPYYLDLTEVTNEQWKAYLDATGKQPESILVKESWIGGKIPKGQAKRPVAFVSYVDAVGFARWALKRLPTEIEWEYAARGPEGRLYPWGDDFDDPDPASKFDADGRRLTQEQIEENIARGAGVLVLTGGQRANCGTSTGKRQTVDVGSFPKGASPFGILDLAGNVWEWTSSPFTPYDANALAIEIKTPTGKRKYTATELFDAEHFVVRGGAFENNPAALVSAVRQGAPRGTRFNTIGFRCARGATAGLDLIDAGLGDLGRYTFRDTPLDLQRVYAVEHVACDARGIIRETKHFAFAPSASVLQDGKRLSYLKEARKRSQTRPLQVGVVSSSVAIVDPPLPPGVYAVACLAKDSDAARDQDKRAFPKDGWYSSSAGAALGSVVVDRSRDHLVLVDVKANVVAALPLADLKESSPLAELVSERASVGADGAPGTPAGEKLTFRFGVQLAGRKALVLSLPLSFASGALDPPVLPSLDATTVEKPE